MKELRSTTVAVLQVLQPDSPTHYDFRAAKTKNGRQPEFSTLYLRYSLCFASYEQRATLHSQSDVQGYTYTHNTFYGLSHCLYTRRGKRDVRNNSGGRNEHRSNIDSFDSAFAFHRTTQTATATLHVQTAPAHRQHVTLHAATPKSALVAWRIPRPGENNTQPRSFQLCVFSSIQVRPKRDASFAVCRPPFPENEVQPSHANSKAPRRCAGKRVQHGEVDKQEVRKTRNLRSQMLILVSQLESLPTKTALRHARGRRGFRKGYLRGP